MKRRICVAYIAMAGFAILGASVASGALAKPAGTKTVSTAEFERVARLAQREEDARQIQNLMSRRAFYHGASLQGREIDLFSRRADASFCQNQGCRVGYDKIHASYVVRYEKNRQMELAKLHQLHPEITEDPSWLHVGNFQMHTLSTPILEIAEDGKTAKGMWYTPGAIAGTNSDVKTFISDWIWEKYAVDFIKEDGVWHFWHVTVVTDFVVPMGKDLEGNIGNAPEGPEGTANLPMIPREVNGTIYKPLSPTTVPTIFPPLPEPYTTFSATFSYGPELLDQWKAIEAKRGH